MDRKDVVIGIVVRNGRVLICQRRQNDSFGGYWEFPGGKRQADESAEQCLARELREELALEIRPVDSFPPIEHDYGAVRVFLIPFLCECDAAEPQPLACQRLEWVLPAELRQYRFPAANAALIERIIARLSLA